MRPFKISALALFLPFLLSACGLFQFFNPAPMDSPGAENPAAQPPASSPGAGAEGPSPNSQPNYSLNLPILSRSEPGGAGWQLVTREIDASEADLNLLVQARFPEMEGEPGDLAQRFNQEVGRVVDAELSVKEQLGSTPVEDPGGFVQMGYQVTSAAGWSRFEPYAASDSNPGALPGEQAVFQGGHGLLAVMFEVVGYFGGAHPGSRHVPLNFDLAEGRPLALAELFRPEADYLQAIADYSIQELLKDPEILFTDFEQAASPSPENYQVWAITPQGILIIFEEYQVAPYAAGPQFVVVPYSALETLLDPAGPLGDRAK